MLEVYADTVHIHISLINCILNISAVDRIMYDLEQVLEVSNGMSDLVTLVISFYRQH